jgi:hypothetical protein
MTFADIAARDLQSRAKIRGFIIPVNKAYNQLFFFEQQFILPMPPGICVPGQSNRGTAARDCNPSQRNQGIAARDLQSRAK